VQRCKTGILWQRWGNSKLQTAFHLSWRISRNYKWWKYAIPEMHEIICNVRYVGMKAIFDSGELLFIWSSGYCMLTKNCRASFQFVTYRHVFHLLKTPQKERHSHILCKFLEEHCLLKNRNNISWLWWWFWCLPVKPNKETPWEIKESFELERTRLLFATLPTRICI
jgi:hypothetical protein